MSSITRLAKIVALILLAVALSERPVHAQQKVNAITGVQWPAASCTGRLVWSPAQQACIQLTASDIAVFALNVTCSTSGNYEIGYTVVSPTTCTIHYSQTPSAATLNDGTNTVTLTTPFTSGTLNYSYTLTSAGTVTFTVSTTGTYVGVAQADANWVPRTFAGVGTAGATGATASGTTAVLSGATGTLPSGGLGNQATYGNISPSGQKIYILMSGGSHTFKDGNTGFPFPFNAPTSFNFTNQYGATVPMYLYESANVLTGTFQIQVVN